MRISDWSSDVCSSDLVLGLREKIRKVLAELGGDPERSAELHPNFLEALAERDLAELRLGYTEVRAPADGIVTQLHLEPGEWLEEGDPRSEEHTSELQSLMRISYAVFCLKKKRTTK